jgi:hypothetical protein
MSSGDFFEWGNYNRDEMGQVEKSQKSKTRYQAVSDENLMKV